MDVGAASDSDDDLLQSSRTLLLKRPSRRETKQKDDQLALLKKLAAEREEHCAMKKRLEGHGAFSQKVEDEDEEEAKLEQQILALSQSNSAAETKRALKGITGLYTDGALPDAELRDRIDAIRSCRKERLGQRVDILRYDAARAASAQPQFQSFASAAEAVAALKGMIREIIDSQGAPRDATAMDVEQGGIAPLQRLQRAAEQDNPMILTHFLGTDRLREIILSNDGEMLGLDQVCSWLFCSAISFGMGCQLSEASSRALIGLMENELIPNDCWFKSWASLSNCLRAWIDVHAACQPKRESSADADKENGASSSSKLDSSPTRINITGLGRLLQLWTSGLADDDESTLDQATATEITVALLRLSLDKFVCLETLDSIHTIITAITNRLEQDSAVDFAEWKTATTKMVFNHLLDFGEVPAVDYSDEEGYFTYALLVEQMPPTIGSLKRNLLCHALEYYMDAPEWETYVLMNLRDMEKVDKIRERASEEDYWFYLASSLVAFESLFGSEKGTLKHNHIRTQAIVVLALDAFQSAMLSWPHSDIKQGKPGAEYGRQTEAALVTEVLSRLNNVSEEVKLVTMRSIQDSNARMTNGVCTTFQNYLSYAVQWAAQQGGLAVKTKLQTSMKQYMKVA